jgi:WD40 repeat protein
VLRGHGAGVWSLAFDEPGQELASAGIDGAIAIWGVADGTLRHTLRLDRQYERLNIDGLAGVTEAQREAMLALGAVSQSAA